MALPRDPLPASAAIIPTYTPLTATTTPATPTYKPLPNLAAREAYADEIQAILDSKSAQIQNPDYFGNLQAQSINEVQPALNEYKAANSYASDIYTTYNINQAVGNAYPDAIVPTDYTVPGTPSVTETNPDKTVPPTAVNTQSTSYLSSMDNAFFNVGDRYGVPTETRIQYYDSAVEALKPIGDTAAGAAQAIVDKGNAVVNTFTSTVNSVVGAVVDVFSGKLFLDAASSLLSTGEKLIKMVGEAAYQNVMGFLEGFKTLDTVLNTAVNIVSDIGQTIKKVGSDIGAVLSQDWDKLSWPDINWNRIKSCFDTETFSKIGTGIGNFIGNTIGNTKLPIGLSLNEMKELGKNLDLKEQLLKQVEDVKNGVTQLGAQALNTLYGQLSAVNNAILSITNLPNSLVGMVNGLVNRLDPLKERQANKAILDYIKNGRVVKDGDEEDATSARDILKSESAKNKFNIARIGGYAGSEEEFNKLSDVDKFRLTQPASAGDRYGEQFKASMAELNDATGVTNTSNFPTPQELNGYSAADIATYVKALPPDQQKAFVDYARANQAAINANGAQERRRAEGGIASQ